MISLNKQFGNFVCKYGAYPTKAEFLVFLYNRYVVHGSKQMLPHAVVEFIDHVFDEFREVMASVTPVEFVRRFESSASLQVRQARESEANVVRADS
jgi:E3 ubiquitin-protein ligase DOA10